MIRVAIADDHFLVRVSMRRYQETKPDLLWAGEAASAEDAISLLRTRHVDVLLLDLSMPGLGGLAALPHIRSTAPHLGIVVLTAYGSNEVRELALSAGASAFLEKICEPGQIVEAVRAVHRTAANDSEA